ncbi:MAG: RnfABCDGE type electron transport complex subunit D [Clostridia bacterium]|nr:RnfABCDGE type electron transport complex subunit D [Clostridia bacterium]
MNGVMNNPLNISSSPHARDRWTTAFIMRLVILALLPTTIIGCVYNGIHATLVVLFGVVTAVLTEMIFDKLCHKPDTWKDGSAVVTGLMLTLSLSPSVPLYAPVVGSIFAILVVKCAFGGLGKNFVNPALAGRCFLLISFGRAMSTFAVDGVSSATPIAMLMTGRTVNITEMFLGTTSGVIGASIVAMLLGGMFLWALDVIHGEICFSVLGGFTLLMGLFGGQGFDPGFLLAHLCGGGVVMGAFFMATDYTTSPVSKLGQMIYGLLIGALGALFRVKGGTADSFSYSIIIANLIVPLIDHFIIPKPYAYRRSAIRRREGDTRSFVKRLPKPVVVLTVITLIAGVALSGVYAITKDTIEEQKRAANAASYRVVLPEADSFGQDRTIDAAIEDMNGGVYGAGFGRVYINECLPGYDAEGNLVGHVVRVTTADGFDGDITLVVGMKADGVLQGISYTVLNETPGMGMRAGEPEFMSQFEGREVERFTLNKAGASDNAPDAIDAVSGATITSTAVVNAVNAGIDFYHNVVIGGED